MRFENRSTIIDAFLAGDSDALLRALPDEFSFRSPMRDYVGRRRAEPILTALSGVLGTTRSISVHHGEAESMVRFAGELAGEPAEGALVVREAELTLFVRPLPVLLRGIKRMEAALAS